MLSRIRKALLTASQELQTLIKFVYPAKNVCRDLSMTAWKMKHYSVNYLWYVVSQGMTIKRSSSYDIKKVTTPPSLSKFNETIIDSNIRLFEQTATTDSQRPIAVVLGWLLGKPEHVKKYTEIYLSEGFDVIQVQVFLKDPFVSKNAKRVADKILQICQETRRRSQPIFIHSLSVGCYVYGEMLNHMIDRKVDFRDFPTRILGQIFDSPVDLPIAPKAFAKIWTNNPILRGLLIMSTNLYFLLARKTKRDIYKASAVFKSNEYLTPTMLLYSVDDPVFVPEIFLLMIEVQLDKGIDAKIVKWEGPDHVAIYRECPEEYRQTIKSFLEENKPSQNSKNSICSHP